MDLMFDLEPYLQGLMWFFTLLMLYTSFVIGSIAKSIYQDTKSINWDNYKLIYWDTELINWDNQLNLLSY